MITLELFILGKLFIDNEVSWLWLLFFLISDWLSWYSLKRALGEKK